MPKGKKTDFEIMLGCIQALATSEDAGERDGALEGVTCDYANIEAVAVVAGRYPVELAQEVVRIAERDGVEGDWMGARAWLKSQGEV